ncbi:hypothetical protein FRC03_012789 [Tulasnella sp. 419]|nr:hypothetical protein FRC02_012429 [Tulasnella sp. 418]KAG8950610.1 hypothetical protein FRC03_012789 [Tulasnella sp. 419]
MVGTANNINLAPAPSSNEPTSLSQYNQNRHELMEILSGLHSLGGIANELPLPQIAVIGSQSVGKSSLIESMSGITLPRDSGTCTRCPMECRLEKADKWSCKISLKFWDERTSTLMSEFPFGGTIHDKGEVEQMLRRAQMAVLRPGTPIALFLTSQLSDIPGNELSFTKNCVSIRVSGPDVPELLFYDLPGIIANVGDGGNEADIELVEELVKSYIRKRHCLILLVVSCETDFENQGAGRLVLKNKALRDNTVGVLTKVDRIELATSQKWVKILKNEETILDHHWFAVKQPNQAQLQARISWEEARRSEKSYFQSIEPWVSLDRGFQQYLGSENLSEHLSLTLSKMIARQLPEIRAKIESLLRQTNEELGNIPERDLKDPRKETIRLLTAFSRKVSKHIEGLPPGSLAAPSGLITTVNKHYEDFQLQVHQTSPRFRPWRSDARLSHADEIDMIRVAEGDDAEDGSGLIIYVDQVCEYAERSRTREWPGDYPFAIKENIVREAIMQWEALANSCFKTVESALNGHLNQLINEHFKQEANPCLIDVVRKTVEEQLNICAKSVKTRIKGTCQGELEKYFTQNHHYFFAFRDKLLNRYKFLYRRSRGEHSFVEVLKTCISPPRQKPPPSPPSVRRSTQYVMEAPRECSPSFSDDIDTILDILARRGLYGVRTEDLAKLLPSTDMDPGLEIMAEIRAYFQVAYKRFGDSVPIDIDTGYIRTFDAGLEVALLTGIPLNDSDCHSYLEEPTSIVQRREELKQRRDDLETAKRKLGQSNLGQMDLDGVDPDDLDEGGSHSGSVQRDEDDGSEDDRSNQPPKAYEPDYRGPIAPVERPLSRNGAQSPMKMPPTLGRELSSDSLGTYEGVPVRRASAW